MQKFEELKDFFEKNGYMMLSDGNGAFALEIMKEGVNIRIYIDEAKEGFSYQAILSKDVVVTVTIS